MERKKIGLALSGGGARGFAHIGVLRVLAEHKIPIDMVAGTSAGSIVGGAFAAGMSVDEIASMASKVGWTNMVRPSLSPLGLLSNAPMGKFLRHHFPVSRFDDMPTPFAAVACDLDTGIEVVLKNTGDLIEAIRSSCAVPGVFAPIYVADGRMLVDGGVVAPTPTDAVWQMGADVVIAVDLLACGATFRRRPRTAVGMMFQAAMTLLRTASSNQHVKADIIIAPEIAHLRPDEIKRRDDFITLGEAAARKMIGDITGLIQ